MDQYRHYQRRQKSKFSHRHKDQQPLAVMESAQVSLTITKPGTHEDAGPNNLQPGHRQYDLNQPSATASRGKDEDESNLASATHRLGRRGSILHTGSAGITTDGPDTTDQIDSDAWHRTSTRE